MERREFLLSVAALGGGLGFPGLLRGSMAAHGGEFVEIELLELWARDAGVCAIGRAWLEREPAERDRELLRARLAETLGPPATRWSRALLLERVQRDYAEERVALLHGWILSRTEARLCALASLTAPPGSARE